MVIAADRRSEAGKSRLSFVLRLADGTRWEIGSSPSAAARLDEFARILGLRRSHGGADRRLLFVRRGDGDRLDMPGTGWVTKELRLIRFHYHVKKSVIICNLRPEMNATIELFKLQDSLFPIYQGVQDAGGVPLHAALIERDGMGVLIAAHGNTGKTTCANRIPLPWKPLCDDDALIVKVEKGGYRAHPFPTWSRCVRGDSGKTWEVERSVPLKAIFFLEQAEKRDEAFAISGSEAAVRARFMHSQMLRDIWLEFDLPEYRRLSAGFFNNMADLVSAVPSFVLRAKLDGRFWEQMDKVLY